MKNYKENQMYMNIHSGEVSPYGGWDYTNEEGMSVNAVDLDEVVPVQWNELQQNWEAVE